MRQQIMKLQEQMLRTQEALASKRSRPRLAGVVQVVMTVISRCSRSPSTRMVDPEDVEMLQDLIVAPSTRRSNAPRLWPPTRCRASPRAEPGRLGGLLGLIPMAAVTPTPVTRLIDAFAQLPGIGPKTASRLTFYLLRRPAEQVEALADAIRDLKQKMSSVRSVSTLPNRLPVPSAATRGGPLDPVRGRGPLDVVAIDRTGEYRDCTTFCTGDFAVEGIGPDELRINECWPPEGPAGPGGVVGDQSKSGGEATAMYLAVFSSRWGCASPPGAGFTVGGDLEYADAVTLAVLSRAPDM